MKAPLSRVTLVSLAVGALLGFATCQVNLTDEIRYTCASDADCGGGGYKCALSGAKAICCKPSGVDDTCDGKDNDCDGLIDNTGNSEICNGVDDNCDGKVDEIFDLKSDPNNCGSCKFACKTQEPCVGGVCVPRKEIDCFDGVDNDENGKIDCLDPSCELRQCGAACLCKGLKKTEALCSDNTDNDGDGAKDCQDPDCVDQACRTGCTCVADGGQSETGCTDGIDNDGDALIDCLDPDCVGRFCTPPQLYFSCTPTLQCKCNGSVQVSEVGSVRCRDGIDNDCNGVTDCGEMTCGGQSCSPDGGLNCECVMGNKKEKDCTNGVDDDGDALVDCADSDCPAGTVCHADGGMCSGTKTCP